jgi:hypothetical protein
MHYLQPEELAKVEVDLSKRFGELDLQDILRLAVFFQSTSSLSDMGHHAEFDEGSF